MIQGSSPGGWITGTESRRDVPPLKLTARGHPRSVTETRKKVAEYADAIGANRDDVELAVTEAVGNAVLHAFGGRDDGVIMVRAEIDGPNRLVVEVADCGSGITKHARSSRAGMGLPIIGALADSVEVQSGQGGTRIVMRFPRAA
jgi:anti-sigma regulatory factor (Ser/Thr protein kinase)